MATKTFIDDSFVTTDTEVGQDLAGVTIELADIIEQLQPRTVGSPGCCGATST